jgi:hypothetical protein
MGSTTSTRDIDAQVEALVHGRAFAVLSNLRLLSVRGADARRWLGDLITADVAGMTVGDARRSLVLTPTGRIRAEALVLAIDDGFVLAQDADQEERVGDVLAPYVLSSAVELADISDERDVLLLEPGRYRCVDRDRRGPLERRLEGEGRIRAGAEALEVVRVRRGEPRIGVDVVVGGLPVGARLDAAIDTGKGCFLGQEAVAKVRDLGHPPTVLLHLRTTDALSPGAPIHTPGGAVGVVTSAAPATGGGTVVLARVDWDAAQAALSSERGLSLEPIED